MHLTDGRLLLSASDLTGFLECPHLTQQELAATRGEVTRPKRDDPELELLARHGTAHEQAHLEWYARDNKRVARIETKEASDDAYAKAAALLQTSLYSELVAGMQGRAPEWMHLALGDGTRPRFRVSDYRAYLHHT